RLLLRRGLSPAVSREESEWLLRTRRMGGFIRLAMTRRLISSGSSFEKEIGYSRAVVDGDWAFVSGTTGFDYASMTISAEVVAQCEQALRKVEAALTEAEASMADVVRVRYILPRREDFELCWPALRRV